MTPDVRKEGPEIDWQTLWQVFDTWAETQEYAKSAHRWNAARDKIQGLVLDALAPLVARAEMVGKMVEALDGVTRKAEIARNELAALVEDPDAPDFSVCLGNRNPADRRCLETAYEMLSRILKALTAKTPDEE